MILILKAFIAKYEVFICLGLLTFFFGLGFYTCHKFHNAEELTAMKIELTKHQEMEKVYHDASDNYQKLNQTLLANNQTSMDNANATKITDCDSKPIGADKLQLLKSNRAPSFTR